MGKYGRVNPETVGQATGILDKLARDIFEGDILKIHHKTPLPVGLAVVKYDKKRSAFRAFPVDRPWYACQIAYPDEIVGNIYDDPDLLKQERTHKNDGTRAQSIGAIFHGTPSPAAILAVNTAMRSARPPALPETSA